MLGRTFALAALALTGALGPAAPALPQDVSAPCRLCETSGRVDDEKPRAPVRLEMETRLEFDSTPLYRRVFEMADARNGKALARAVVPSIELHSPKFTRTLTTQWFAERVVQRHRQCLARGKRTTERDASSPMS